MNTQNNGVVGLTLSIHIERSKLLCLCLDDVGFLVCRWFENVGVGKTESG